MRNNHHVDLLTNGRYNAVQWEDIGMAQFRPEFDLTFKALNAVFSHKNCLKMGITTSRTFSLALTPLKAFKATWYGKY
jgi:hypothetical protein